MRALSRESSLFLLACSLSPPLARRQEGVSERALHGALPRLLRRTAITTAAARQRAGVERRRDAPQLSNGRLVVGAAALLGALELTVEDVELGACRRWGSRCRV